jgi:hypothetical protein
MTVEIELLLSRPSSACYRLELGPNTSHTELARTSRLSPGLVRPVRLKILHYTSPLSFLLPAPPISLAQWRNHRSRSRSSTNSWLVRLNGGNTLGAVANRRAGAVAGVSEVSAIACHFLYRAC